MVASSQGTARDVPSDGEELSLLLPCDVGAPRKARAALMRLSGIDDVRGDALLVVFELVTNAVVHSGAGPQEMIEVTVSRTEEGLSIAVRDPGLHGGVAEVEVADRCHGGWGLRVVQEISRRWGRELTQGHKVWVELAL